MVASEAEGQAQALRRIAACHAARGDELDLGGLQLSSLDDILKPLCELTWLRRLFLDRARRPEKIGNWRLLTEKKTQRYATRLAWCLTLYSTR
jgi:hypothetical protein